MRPDLTGMYEHIPSRGRNAGLLLQLNQAGFALVGWFIEPPRHVLEPAALASLKGARAGVLYAIADKATWEDAYLEQTQLTDEQIRDPAARFLLDPTDLVSRDGLTVGRLRFVPPDMGLIGQEVQIMFDVAGKNMSDPGSWDRFRRVGRGPRLPNLALDALDPQLHDAVIANQVQPAPTTNVELMCAKLIGTSQVDRPGTELERRIVAFVDAGGPGQMAFNTKERAIARDNVVQLLAGATQVNVMQPAYRARETGMLRAKLSQRDLVIGQDKKSLLDWLKTVAAEEIDRLHEEQKANPDRAVRRIDHPNLKVLDALGISGVGQGGSPDYRYTFEFKEVSEALGAGIIDALSGAASGKPRSLSEHAGQTVRDAAVRRAGDLIERVKKAVMDPVRRLVPPLPFIGMTARLGVVMMNVTCERVIARRDKDGLLVYKDGKPVIQGDPKPDQVWKSQNQYCVLFFGAGTGLKGSANTGWEHQSSSASLSKTEILSAHQVTDGDFGGAMITTATLNGPLAKLGGYLSVDALSSRGIAVTLSRDHGGITLSTDEAALMNADLVTPGKLIPDLGKDATKARDEWNKKFVQPELELRLLDLSGAAGYVLPLDIEPSSRTTHEAQPIHPHDLQYAAGEHVVQSFFTKGSAQLDSPSPLMTTSIRVGLEVGLATYLAYLVNPRGVLECVAYTSPEQPSDANQALSDARARAVRRATHDALGSSLTARFAETDCAGLGERPARAAGLDDPEEKGLTVEQFREQFPGQWETWPIWRRADLFLNGEATISFGHDE